MCDTNRPRRRTEGFTMLEVVSVFIVLVILVSASLARFTPPRLGFHYGYEARGRLLAEEGEVLRHSPDSGGIPHGGAAAAAGFRDKNDKPYYWNTTDDGVHVQFLVGGVRFLYSRHVAGRRHALTPSVIDKHLLYKEKIRRPQAQK